MSEAQPETVADPVVEAQKALVTAIWHCISDASSMNVVMSGGEVNAAMRHFRLAIEAEARAAGAARYEAALRQIAEPQEVAGECIWCMTDMGHAADPDCPVTVASRALAAAPLPEPLPQGDGLDVMDGDLLGRRGHEPGDAGTPEWEENIRKEAEAMNAQLRLTPSRPAEERKP